jgi:hypothetical protein
MNAFAPISAPSRSQRDAESDDARAQRLASDFGKLLESRREALVQKAAAQAESSVCQQIKVTQISRLLAHESMNTGTMLAKAPEHGEFAGVSDGCSPPAHENDMRMCADKQGRSKVSERDNPHKSGQSPYKPEDSEVAAAKRSAETEPADAVRMRLAQRLTDGLTTSIKSVEEHRMADESMSSRAADFLRARASDHGHDGDPAWISTVAFVKSDIGCEKQAYDSHLQASPAVIASGHRFVTPEVVAEVARLLAERIEQSRDHADQYGSDTWQFSLTDEHDYCPVVFVITRNATGTLSLKFDDGSDQDASLLNELATRLAELDPQIMLEITYG